MKKSINLLFKFKLIIAFLLGLNTTLLGQISHSASFSRSNLTFDVLTAKDGVDYEKVAFDDLQQTDDIGKPNLPVRYVSLIILSDQNVNKIIVTFADWQKLSGSHLICPTQPPILTSSEFHERDFVKPDPDV